MQLPRWSLSGLFSVVLFAALAAGGYRAFYTDQHPNAWLWLALFLALLTTATLGAWRGHAAIQRACMGYAAFGWAHLVFVLILYSWPVKYIQDAENLTRNARIGMLLGLLAAIGATWMLRPAQEAAPPT